MVIEENNSKSNCNSNGVHGYMNGGGGGASGSGCGNGGGNGSSLRTYKRQKLSSSSLSSHHIMVKEIADIGLRKYSCEQVFNPKKSCHSVVNGSDDCSNQYWRSVLESICHSLCCEAGNGSGLQNCIRDALLSNPGTSHANIAKEMVGHHRNLAHLVRIGMTNGFSGASKGFSTVYSNGAQSDLGHSTVSLLCQHVFYRLMMSGQFASLCKLLSENLHGLKVEKFLDFSLINSRISDGAYEHVAMQFSSDIQQIWSRLRLIGNEMVSLSHSMSELSRAFCHELQGDAENDIGSDKKCELPTQKYDVRIKQEELDTSVFCTCRQCGERSDGRDCLVCDSCEEMFHVSCIKPAVTEIPHKSWYCANCTASGIGSPHAECDVCERLITNLGDEIDAVPISEALGDDEESLNVANETGIQVYKESKRSHTCKICGSILYKGDEFQVCKHPFCSYKVYHTRCLMNKELKTYGPRWYCPSCLCRVCLTNKDDDDLCLCDGCDHGYHIYCMNPPRASVPKGKWFCPKCDMGIKAIRRVKKVYEDLERKKTKAEGKKVMGNSHKLKLELEDSASGSGGMGMLLTAARTLKHEEFDVQNG